MEGYNVIVTGWEKDLTAARELAERLRVVWCEDGLSIEALDVETLRQEPPPLDAVIIVSRHDVPMSETLPLLAQLEEAAVAVVALVADEAQGGAFEFSGTVVESLDMPVEPLASLVRGMLLRQREVWRLRDELAISYRYHGGVNGEITKMQEELQLAAMVQREFLPRMIPHLHGVEIAALWRPAHYVSGDLYDAMRLDEDHIGVFLADVAGHGVRAALMTMVICRSLVVKETEEHEYRLVPPAEVLGRLNLDLRRRNKHIRFATAVYALVDCRRRVMTLAGAGHPPPLLLRPGAPARELATDGGLLGVFEDERYEQMEIPLECGDRVIFYSDGFEQAFPHRSSNDYERKMPTDRYREEFQRLESCGTASEMIACIADRLDDQRGSLHQIDDLTLLCLHAGPLPQDALEANRHQRSAAA